MNKLFFTFLLFILLTSCSEYQKAIKTEDMAKKLDVATKMYEKGKFDKAIRLFEVVAPVYRGKPEAESMFYMYSQSLYKTKQYYLAGYQFESFAALYPKSEKLQEASFLGAKSYAQLSPVYSLDQVDTEKAIVKLQSFIDTFSNSEYLPEANAITKTLTDKLEKKAYEIAKQYNTISEHKAALKAFDSYLSDYPGSVFKEKVLFYKYDSAYQLAINSIETKMEERLNNAKIAHGSLVKFNPNSEYKEKADEMLARIEKDLQQFSK